MHLTLHGTGYSSSEWTRCSVITYYIFCLSCNPFSDVFFFHPADSCFSSPCANGGMCISDLQNNQFSCTCVGDFIGDLCQFPGIDGVYNCFALFHNKWVTWNSVVKVCGNPPWRTENLTVWEMSFTWWLMIKKNRPGNVRSIRVKFVTIWNNMPTTLSLLLVFVHIDTNHLKPAISFWKAV